MKIKVPKSYRQVTKRWGQDVEEVSEHVIEARKKTADYYKRLFYGM